MFVSKMIQEGMGSCREREIETEREERGEFMMVERECVVGVMSLRKEMGSSTRVAGPALDEYGQLFCPGITSEKAECNVLMLGKGSYRCGNLWKLSI